MKCHKEVAETNFALHETHCSRFLCLCPDCDEAVPREQLNQHREEQHTQVRCSKCNQKMECCHLMDHESDECVERLQTCQFCELELPWKELDKHSQVCGSRTELCRDCNRYVKLRDQPEHNSTCSATNNGSSPPQTTSTPPNKTKVTVSCSGCMMSFPAEDIEKHELECVQASRWDYYKEAKLEEEKVQDEGGFCRQVTPLRLSSTYKATSLADRLGRGPWGDGGDPDQISTCPHCHLALPLFTLRWHKAKCQIYILLK
ncbi:XIAP-associated factor 1 isoform X2 [Xiphias gladius]|uniref:XIAP-associated factor 1 isoform X2 n=1 Tax=Xiphias gladius TaxID=8245 RepID=UPI001A990195|nr:XIAP-associated factor 1 isoform X2 [Xiphias gladius]XP_039987600.1 XIAP-associated factor 1 isoform X2 [Xiphias gladius]